MHRYDLTIPGPGSSEALPVSGTGDLVLVRGLPSLQRWVERALVCRPGGLLTDPDFGAGAEDLLGGDALTAQQRISSRARETIQGDRRVRAVRVPVRVDPTRPGHVVVDVQIEAVDGSVDQMPVRI